MAIHAPHTRFARMTFHVEAIRERHTVATGVPICVNLLVTPATVGSRVSPRLPIDEFVAPPIEGHRQNGLAETERAAQLVLV